MSEVVSYRLDGDIGIISINSPPVNALSTNVLKGIADCITQAQQDDSIAVVLICEGRTFIAGADIGEFDPASSDTDDFQVAFNGLENSAKPVVAAIHGTAFGGGLETALCCHYRCAVADAKVGLPEVKLGLLPGAGGTQRLPRLIGVEAALDFIISGKPIAATAAAKAGVIDRIVEGDLLAAAIAFAKEVGASGDLPKVRDLPAPTAADGFFDEFRKKNARKLKGLVAQENIIRCVEGAVALDFDAGLAQENKLFIECLQSPQSAAQIHAFFAQRKTANIPDIPKDIEKRPVNSVGIVGAGLMGGGICMNFIQAGIPVTLIDMNDEALERGIKAIRKNYDISLKKGRFSKEKVEGWMSLINSTTSYDGLKDVDLVIEAVFESMPIKKDIFKKLDEACKPGAILASNTSELNIDEIASVTKRPEDVIGMHFFSPANVMQLLEVIRAEKSSKDAIATAMSLAKKIRKVPVLARVCPGFIGNRMFNEYTFSSFQVIAECASPTQVDKALESWGMAMGPAAVFDLVGLDLGFQAKEADDLVGKVKEQALVDALVVNERCGQKNGLGFYQYDTETRKRMEDPAAVKIIKETAAKWNIEPRELTDEEIIKRTIYPMINEGAYILEEGIAIRASDLDIVFLYGYGFPAFRGGPMHFADATGLATICKEMNQIADETGDEKLRPAPLLKQLAEEGKTLAQWDKENTRRK